ncbi:MAG: DinB family protein [Terracidiphilus sp.]|nr:DinB family protein [Terracidiphilus sp.]
MTPAITLQELLVWSKESSDFWHEHLLANPSLLELPCSIGGTSNVQGFVRHIWAVDLRWSQRIAGLPELPREDVPAGPLDALYGLHQQAVQIFSALLNDPAQDWDAIKALEYDWLPAHARTASRRKLMAHALFHSQRHWAQLATLVREAGFPVKFPGDLLFSSAL